MFTFNFFVRTDNTPLRLRFVNNRRKSEMRLDISVTDAELKNALSGKPAPSNAALARLLSGYNQMLRKLQIDLLEEGNQDMEVDMIRDRASGILLKKPETSDVAEEKTDPLNWEKYYEKYVKTKRNRSYRDSCQYTLNKMRELCKNLSELKFDDITLKWLKDFDESLIKAEVSQNTRNIHFKNIRTCLNRAIDEELTVNYPFRRFKIRAEETRKRNLPVKELRRLFNYNVEEYQKYYLDYFKLIFMLIGINTIDLYNLTKIENGRIEYRRAKTHKLYSIKVEPEAMEIIKRHRAKNNEHLLDITDRWKDYRDFQKNCNIALKNIGTVERTGRGGKKEVKAEWPDLSTYWARHSWSTIAYSIDIPKDIISQALGHSSGNAITEIYIERDQKKVDEANRRVLDWVLYGKS